jgi:NifU-like protein involved in Fe-S cluster formation
MRTITAMIRLQVNSMLTNLALGKTVAEAKKLCNADIKTAFQSTIGLQTGCPLAGIQALSMSIADYEIHKYAGVPSGWIAWKLNLLLHQNIC